MSFTRCFFVHSFTMFRQIKTQNRIAFDESIFRYDFNWYICIIRLITMNNYLLRGFTSQNNRDIIYGKYLNFHILPYFSIVRNAFLMIVIFVSLSFSQRWQSSFTNSGWVLLASLSQLPTLSLFSSIGSTNPSPMSLSIVLPVIFSSLSVFESIGCR